MLSLSDYEKLIHIDTDQEIVEKRNRILPKIDKTERKIFFTSYRYKNFHFLISSYLSDKEKINFLYLNRFTLTNLKKMFNESGYKTLKNNLMILYQKGKTFNDLIQDNANILLKKLNFFNDYQQTDDFYTAINLIGKWMNKLYFEKKEKEDSNTNISILSTVEDNLGNYGSIFLLFTLAHNSTIEAIDLRNSNLDGESLKYLKFALKKEKPVQSLNLEKNNISDGIQHIVTCFDKLKNVKYLNLAKTCMNKSNAELCASHLNKLSKLEVIILDDNPITSFGARDILYSLLNLTNIKILSFRNTDLDENFAGPLGTFLTSKEIESIDLSENKFLNKGFVKNFSFFFPKAKLKFLYFDSCALTITDLEIILEGFESNPNLIFLNLNRNDSSPNIAKKIKELVDNNSKSKKIYYEGKRFSSKKEKFRNKHYNLK